MLDYDYSFEDNFDYKRAEIPYEYGQFEAENALSINF